MAQALNVPQNELGHAGATLVPWTGLSDVTEDVPELAWPNSVKTYEAMSKDAQVAGLVQALVGPICQYRWHISPNGARDEVVQHISDDLNIPILGTDGSEAPTPRRKRRFSLKIHMLETLSLALRHGFMPYEKLARVDSPKPGGIHLAKLAPRHPATLFEVDVDDSGDLLQIQQYGSGRIMTTPSGSITGGTFGNYQTIKIPADRLVYYPYAKESGNWYGRSLLRAMYKNWLLKDRLLRVDALKHERNGMGLPEYEAPAGADQKIIDALSAKAQAIRAGQYSGGASPYGSRLRLVGVEGTLPDTLASIRYHDEQMAQRALAMFMKLGTTASGSRALGSEFVDYFAMAQVGLAEWFQNITNADLLEDMVTWNWGEDEQAPTLVFDRDDAQVLSVAEVVMLINSGGLTLDVNLENYIRSRGGLPDRMPDDPPPALPSAQGGNTPDPAQPDQANTPQPNAKPAAAGRGGHSHQIRADRKPSTPEEQAGVDFALIEQQWNDAVNSAVASWGAVRSVQIDQLVSAAQAMADRGDVVALADLAVQADGTGSSILGPILVQIAEAGLAQAAAEAASQGVEAATPVLSQASLNSISVRAAAVEELLARGISETAARKATLITGSDGNGSEEVGDRLREHLTGLSDSYLRDQLGGAVSAAMNTGRRQYMASAPDADFYASELMDKNTCLFCRNIDEHKYSSLEAAEADYPTGGYANCAAGPRCRGTLVAVYHTESQPSVA